MANTNTSTNIVPDDDLPQGLNLVPIDDLPDTVIEKPKISTSTDDDDFGLPLGDINPQEAYKKLRPYLKTTAEGVGLAGGGVLGAVGGPVGVVAGAGLGYAAGKEVTDILDKAFGLAEEKPLPEELTQSGMDILEGAALEAGGQGFSKAIQVVGKKAIPIAKRWYESALKPSVTLKPSVVEKRVTTGLKEKITVSKTGLSEAQSKISELNETISNRINQYATQGEKVAVSKAVKPIDKLRLETEAKSITPTADIARIDRYKKEVLKVNPEEIPIANAQVFKQTINKELDDFYTAINKGKVAPPKSVLKVKAAMADGLRKEIVDIFPEVTKLNAKEGALIELNKSLGRAVNRIQNRELIPLVVAIATGVAPAHSLWKALVLKTIEHPTVKSKLAIMLFNANKKTLAEVGKRTVQAGAIASEADNAIQE